MALSPADDRKLFVLSHGRCNLCGNSVYNHGTYVGEKAHIVARRIKGARGTERDGVVIDSYDNHILLCGTHHTEIDNNPDYYAVGVVLGIKRDHEARMEASGDTSVYRANTIAFIKEYLRFADFRNIPQHLDRSPYRLSMQVLDVTQAFDSLIQAYPFTIPLHDNALQHCLHDHIVSFRQLDYALKNQSQTIYGIIDHYIQAGFSDYICINSNYFSEDQHKQILNDVSCYVDSCIRSYNTLGQHIRLYYPEINI